MRPTMRLARGTVVALALLSALIPPRSPTPGPAAAAETLTGPDLVRALQQGGFVLYFRHTTTARDQEDADRIALDRCETQRGLSEEGRRLAREIGAAFRTLRIPIGRVLSSPFCRCLDTATLAFGRYEKLDLLTYGLRESAERSSRGCRSAGSCRLAESRSTGPSPPGRPGARMPRSPSWMGIGAS